ncbi:hypothetical protein TWF481_012012 [Arthrobotrys musiformis]|uniref:Uncharacterized protein n=1 Tax=Arthrobotrys musiformis TaxID=47236 RepID=A0AAV9VYL8_9PEZI
MRRVRDCAKNITGVDGLISNILEMLQDEDAVRYNLRTAMENLHENANRCVRETNSMHEKFEMLLKFVMALQTSIIEQLNRLQLFSRHRYSSNPE